MDDLGRQVAAWKPEAELWLSLPFVYSYRPAPRVAQTVKNLPAVQETQVRFLGREHPLEKGMATYSSILAWEIPGSPWGHRESDTTERLHMVPWLGQ